MIATFSEIMNVSPHTPVFAVFRGEENITGKLSDRTISLTVSLSNGGGSDQLSLVLDDRGWQIATPHGGESLTVLLGYEETGLAPLGTFEIETVRYSWLPKQITIRGTSLGTRSAVKSPVVKNYDNKTLGDIVRDIASSHGATANVSPELDQIRVPYLNSITSPMNLLAQLEQRFGAVAKWSGSGQMSFTARDSGVTASGQTAPLVVLRPGDIAELDIENASRTSYSKTRAAWYDRDQLVRRYVEAPAPEGSNNADFPAFTMGRLFPSQAEAEAAAKSQMAALTRNEATGSITLSRGDPFVRDQSRVLITGSRDGIDGSYIAEVVTHAYRKDVGVTTTLELVANGDGATYQQADDNDNLPLPGETTGGRIVLDSAGRVVGGV